MRPEIDGKFIRIGSERYYLKGITYGTFAPDLFGYQFPSTGIVDADFSLMAKSGINTVRTYTIPSIEILDLAQKYGLKIMIGLPWEQHITFLDSEQKKKNIIKKIIGYVNSCNRHPAILCYTIGNEIPAQIVRWYGDKKIAAFLYKLYKAVKISDPGALVTYVNYPTTEYLQLPFIDFNCFNVYLETREKLLDYLMRLHNLTGDKPLVLAEIGLDSFRNGKEKQAEVLDWQIRTIFEKGCAGTLVFSWTDEWWRGGAEILDWDFGLVDRDRNPKAALEAVKKAYAEVPFPSAMKFPKISVVVCSYNGAKTIRDTMEGLKKLDYPDFEVIVINDGSNDATQEIVSDYNVKLISTKNGGLSRARNRGIDEATGEIIAYIDDDAYPDPQWLKYLASLYLNSDFAGIGGPNIAPDGDGPIAFCVSNAPGRPVHVLTSDEIAEHIPGCNMSFRRNILQEIGGFDSVFRAAGDDVDICWRIQEKGYTIGFHPSAFVWHHCRNSIRMYWKQQIGYGKAEALLEKKWPERYNSLGHLTWEGYIYGNGLTKSLKSRKKIFYGSQGSSLFQSVYQPADGFFRVLPLMPEWYLLIVFLGVVSLLGIEWPLFLWTIPIFIASVSVLLLQAGKSANHEIFNHKPEKSIPKLKSWGLTILLHLIQPVARLKGRINNGLTLWRDGLYNLVHIRDMLFASRLMNHWSEDWKPAHEWLGLIQNKLKSMKNAVRTGSEFDRWDIENSVGLFGSARTLLTIEEHGMGKQMVKIKGQIKFPVFGFTILMGWFLISVLTFNAHNYISGIVFLILTILLGLKILADISGTIGSLNRAMKDLPDGIKDKGIDSEPGMEPATKTGINENQMTEYVH
jgi:O-antigen biosynthesis protein